LVAVAVLAVGFTTGLLNLGAAAMPMD
jgi:hypothetical protein